MKAKFQVGDRHKIPECGKILARIYKALMVTIKFEEVIWIDGSVLVVFHTPAKCWQFRIINSTGEVFGEELIYYTALAALNAGRSWLGLPGM